MRAIPTGRVDTTRGGRGAPRRRAAPLALVAEQGDEDLPLAEVLPLHPVSPDSEPRAGILEPPLQAHRDLLLDELVPAVQALALHQRIPTATSMTVPSTLPS